MVITGRGDFIPQALDNFARQWVGEHYLIASALIVILIIIILWFIVWKSKEGFNPTQNMRDQDSDQFGLGKKERLDNPRDSSAFAQQTQSAGGSSFTVNPNAPANQPGSLAWQVLHNSDFNCDKRTASPEDAWMWMSGVARENLSPNKPKTDDDFSKVLVGN